MPENLEQSWHRCLTKKTLNSLRAPRYDLIQPSSSFSAVFLRMRNFQLLSTMFASNYRLFYLLAFLPCWSAAQLTFPVTVEVDLIFPRNNTYSPTAHMPIVFAIQNSRYAVPLDLSFQYTLFNGSGVFNTPLVTYRELNLTSADFSSSDPYFAIDSVPYMNTTEGVWTFTWTSFSGNCSYTVINGTHNQAALGAGVWGTHVAQDSGPIEFTIKNGAQQPDLVAATADDTCANSGNFTFNVTGTLNVTYPPLFNGRSSCAVLPTPLSTPPANPCGAKLNSSAASSILAAITSCAVHQPTATTGCVPLTTSDGFGRGEQFPLMVFLLATSVWLMYFV